MAITAEALEPRLRMRSAIGRSSPVGTQERLRTACAGMSGAWHMPIVVSTAQRAQTRVHSGASRRRRPVPRVPAVRTPWALHICAAQPAGIIIAR